MSPGFRYHVITVAAIFLALGIGIVMGMSVVQGAIVGQVNRTLEALRNQYNRDVQPLKLQNSRYAEFVGAMTPGLLASQVRGARISIIQPGDYPDTVRRI